MSHLEGLDTYRLHRRFDRLARLIGDTAMERLMRAHVMVVGLGGVGSWAAEAIARSGVGTITLVDFDSICVTNFNRQLHALNRLVGQSKSTVMSERLAQVNPDATIRELSLFYNADTAAQIFSVRPDFVIDAIDNMTAKAHLINHCRQNDIPMVVSTGSGGRLDPTRVTSEDLGLTSIDPLARELRKILRQKYGFPAGSDQPFGIHSVYSTEPATDPLELHYDQDRGFRCVCPQGDNPYFNCDTRNRIMGTSSFVTGAFGLVCASLAVRSLLGRHV